MKDDRKASKNSKGEGKAQDAADFKRSSSLKVKGEKAKTVTELKNGNQEKEKGTWFYFFIFVSFKSKKYSNFSFFLTQLFMSFFFSLITEFEWSV